MMMVMMMIWAWSSAFLWSLSQHCLHADRLYREAYCDAAAGKVSMMMVMMFITLIQAWSSVCLCGVCLPQHCLHADWLYRGYCHAAAAAADSTDRGLGISLSRESVYYSIVSRQPRRKEKMGMMMVMTAMLVVMMEMVIQMMMVMITTGSVLTEGDDDGDDNLSVHCDRG